MALGSTTAAAGNLAAGYRNKPFIIRYMMFAIARMNENSRSGDYLELSSDEDPFEMHPGQI